MRRTNRLVAALLACAALLTAAGAQTLPRVDREDDARARELISEGLGVRGVYVGRSTADDVASIYGKTFETVEHGDYSYEMRYAALGLSFYYCRADEQKRVFDIEARAPFRGFTARGITLGRSTLREVFAAYGEVEPTTSDAKERWSFSYPGVEFSVAYKELGDRPVASLSGAKVTSIEVTTRRAGSDCNTPGAK